MAGADSVLAFLSVSAAVALVSQAWSNTQLVLSFPGCGVKGGLNRVSLYTGHVQSVSVLDGKVAGPY